MSIYKIYCPTGDLTKVYYGSTFRDINVRFKSHLREYKQWKDDKYHFITSFSLFDEYGYDNCVIELIETIDTDDKQQLIDKESEYIRNNQCVNKYIPNRTKEMYREEHRDHLLEVQREYWNTNKEKLNELRRIVREENKVAVNEKKRLDRLNNSEHHKELDKQNYIRNREAKLARAKLTAEKNKEKLQSLVECECGSFVKFAGISTHKKTKAHIAKLSTLSSSTP